ncbi:zinc finger BED domain-containing protein RICESLEEPER 2 [Tanacetum coccineum]
MFPVLSRMAMDIISVQASSVASESAFSTSGRVLSIRRTRLTPASLEMCMCLKDHLDAKERKQDKCPLETPLDFEEGVFDDEVQQNEAIPLSDEEIALDASSEGTMSPGGPRYPHDLLVKLNYDAAFKNSNAAYVLGNPFHAISPLHVEIIAVHYACSLASDRGWFNATLESDSQQAISLACSETTPPWCLATLVDDIRLWTNNLQLSFSWVNR